MKMINKNIFKKKVLFTMFLKLWRMVQIALKEQHKKYWSIHSLYLHFERLVDLA